MADTLALALPLCGLIVVLLGLIVYLERVHRAERAEYRAELLAVLKASPPSAFAPVPPPLDDSPPADMYDDPVPLSPGLTLANEIDMETF